MTYKENGGGQRPVHPYADRRTARLRTRSAEERAAFAEQEELLALAEETCHCTGSCGYCQQQADFDRDDR